MEEELNKKSDEELVLLARENQEYFLYIVQRYKEKLHRYIMRLTNIDPEDAEDVLQDVFLKVYINLNDFDHSLKFSSWIYRITHNQVISHYRKLKVRPHGNTIVLEDKDFNNIASDFNLEKEIDGELLKDSIGKILDRLDIKYREVLILKFLESKSYEEISDIIKRPMGTVASLINRAKQEFQKEISESIK